MTVYIFKAHFIDKKRVFQKHGLLQILEIFKECNFKLYRKKDHDRISHSKTVELFHLLVLFECLLQYMYIYALLIMGWSLKTALYVIEKLLSTE